MLSQESYVRLSFQACTATRPVPASATPLAWDELVVVGDTGGVWVGPAAFLTCLWAFVDWREWSYRHSGPAFAPLAERFFGMLSSRRKGIAAWLDHDRADGSCRVRRLSRR
jgi:hypothetical protein